MPVEDKGPHSCIYVKGLYTNTAEKKTIFKRKNMAIANSLSELFLAVRNAG
jgi:hypothetical protein